ncbi:MAG: GAF domain-containing protein, partial [Actinomycetota bacterium]|nr:GAF domain-containing protein [Actinomycetota bacterium]
METIPTLGAGRVAVDEAGEGPPFDALDRLSAIAGAQTATSELLDCDVVTLFLYEREADLMHGWGPDGEPTGSVPALNAGVVGRVFVTGVQEIVDLALTEEDAARAPGLGGAHYACVAPIAARRRLGVLVATNEVEPFTERDLAILSVVADRSALVLENLHLQAVVERQGQQLD